MARPLAAILSLLLAASGGCGPHRPPPHATRPIPGAYIIRAVPLALPTRAILWRDVRPALLACSGCHTSGGVGGGRLVYTSPSLRTTPADAAADYATALGYIDLATPANSPLLRKAAAQDPHGGGAPWPRGSASYSLVLDWIASGATYQ